MAKGKSVKKFKCRCGKVVSDSEKVAYQAGGYPDFFTGYECRECHDGIARAIQAHAESGARWEKDFGDRPVVDYDNGCKPLGMTAKQYRKSKGL